MKDELAVKNKLAVKDELVVKDEGQTNGRLNFN